MVLLAPPQLRLSVGMIPDVIARSCLMVGSWQPSCSLPKMTGHHPSVPSPSKSVGSMYEFTCEQQAFLSLQGKVDGYLYG